MTREEVIAEHDAEIKKLAEIRGMNVEEYLKRYPEMRNVPDWEFYPEIIDVAKEYKTKNGKRIICLERVSRNSLNKRVTYPIKGGVVAKEHPLKVHYCIWSEKGEIRLDEEHGLDIDLSSAK